MAEKTDWQKQWGYEHRRAISLAQEQMGVTGITIPDDWRKPSLRQRLLNFIKPLWPRPDAQEIALVTAYRRCDDKGKAALLLLAGAYLRNKR